VLTVVSVLLVAGCSFAPLEGKGCPCNTPAYKCCNAVCIPEQATCACESVTLASPLITTAGREVVPDAGTDANTVLTIDSGREVQLVFGAEPEQWVSYGFKGANEISPRAELTEDGNGFHVQAPLSHSGSSGTLFVGFGVTFRSRKCVDGTAYSGVQFDLSGSMLGAGLLIGVTSAGSVSNADDPDRGACVEKDLATPVCYGPSASITDLTPPIRADFSSMTGGKPLQTDQLVNVQWQVNDGASVGVGDVDFIVKNVSFY
jgi:hypothetical protein